MEDILRKLVAIPSVSGVQAPNQAIIEYMTDFVATRGMHVRQFERNNFHSMVATTIPHDLAPALMLVVHTDVVPGPQELFTLRQKDGKYFGRGVYDMKFAAAIFLQLIDHLQGNLGQYSLGLMVTSDEEIGGKNGAKYLVEKIGYRPKVCIVPDGGDDWQLEEFAKGVQWISLEASGINAHASRPWEGENAVHKLLDALAELRQLFPATTDKRATILSATTIEGGQAGNQMAAHAKAMLDVRHGSMADYEKACQEIPRICKAHGVETKMLVSDPPCVNPMTNPYIKTFCDIATEVLAVQPSSSFGYAASDGRYFSAVGIPCIIVEPPGGGRHSLDEWISIEGCEQFYEMIRRYAEQVGRVNPRSSLRQPHLAKNAPVPLASLE